MAMNTELENLASNIKRLRDERDWSQTDLARRAGVGQRTVGNAEAGKNISMDSANRIAMALGVSLVELMVPAAVGADSLADRVIYMVAATRGEYMASKRTEGGR
jgi:transcriptional regulator with XRE-family HTH domain